MNEMGIGKVGSNFLDGIDIEVAERDHGIGIPGGQGQVGHIIGLLARLHKLGAQPEILPGPLYPLPANIIEPLIAKPGRISQNHHPEGLSRTGGGYQQEKREQQPQETREPPHHSCSLASSSGDMVQ